MLNAQCSMRKGWVTKRRAGEDGRAAARPPKRATLQRAGGDGTAFAEEAGKKERAPLGDREDAAVPAGAAVRDLDSPGDVTKTEPIASQKSHKPSEYRLNAHNFYGNEKRTTTVYC